MRSSSHNVHEFLGHNDDFLDGFAVNERLDFFGSVGGGFQFGLGRAGRDGDDIAELAVGLDGNLEGTFDQ